MFSGNAFNYSPGVYTIGPPIHGLLPKINTEPTPFQNSTSKVAVLRLHVITPARYWVVNGLSICSRIGYYLYNLKNMKNNHGGALLLVKLQAFWTYNTL